MPNKEKAIDKIRKLLALANSSNEHEAALAAAHAQRILSENNLSMSDQTNERQASLFGRGMSENRC